jgi:hypothetical protein
MEIQLSEINWFAVVAATVAYSAFSGIWHRRFAFGKKWEDAMGFKRPEGWKETTIYFIVPSAACFVTSATIAVLLKNLSISNGFDALTLGLIAGIGFATTVTFTNAVIPTMKKPLVFGAITGTAHAVGITIATFIIYLIG